MFDDRLIKKEEKLKLLDLCYDKKEGREIALRRFLDILELISIVKERKIEHIHCHFAQENVEMAYLLKQIMGLPYTFTTHAFDIFVNPDKKVEKWADNAKKVISVSKFNKDYMHEKLRIPLEKMEIVTYSKYVDKLKPVEKYIFSPFKIISVSRLAEKKGYPYLIEACKILKNKGIDFSCEIQGEGHLKEELRNLIKKNNLEEEIRLGRALTHEEVLDFIRSGSIFVLPCIVAKNNDMDGIPNVLMESMALEIPTISTHVTGISELIEDGVNGILVKQKNAEELAEAIMEIKNNRELAERIRKKGREKVMEKFNVEKNVHKLAEVFAR